MRMKRRGYIRSYIKVPERTKKGREHLHVILEGNYVAQAYISEQWQEIHQAKIVDIRRCKESTGRKRLANEMAKYMAKENAGRYSWSWGWVWKGFCKDWTALKRSWNYHNSYGANMSFQDLLRIWRHFLHQKIPKYLYQFLDEYAAPKGWQYMD